MLGDLFGRKRMQRALEQTHLRGLLGLFSAHFEGGDWVAEVTHQGAGQFAVSLHAVEAAGPGDEQTAVALDAAAHERLRRHLTDLRRLHRSPSGQHWNRAVFRSDAGEFSLARDDWR